MPSVNKRRELLKKIEELEFKQQHELLTREVEMALVTKISELKEQYNHTTPQDAYPPNQCYICGRTNDELKEMPSTLGAIKLTTCDLDGQCINLCQICSGLFNKASNAAYKYDDYEDDDD